MKNIFLIAILFLINSLHAQDDKKVLDFLHSGTVVSTDKIIKIPIEVWNDFILLKVKVNGYDATFMWDNGFSVSGIDNSLVEPYELISYNTGSEVMMTDGNNVNVNVGFVVCPKFEIEEIMLCNTPFVKIDFRTITSTKNLKIEGVLGASLINKLNWKFDFDNNYVEISKKPFAVNNSDLILPFSIINTNLHFMPIIFNGLETECQMDFGYNGDNIEINTSKAKFFSEADAAKTFGPKSISVSGLAPLDTIYTIKDNFSWKLSGKKLNAKAKISFSKAADDVVIGNKIFRDTYNLIINTSGEMVYALSSRVKPVSETVVNAYGYKLYNVGGKFKIMSIESNANTINNGIKLLDEVVSINGKVPADFEDNHTLRMYQKELLAEQKQMILKLKDGREVFLTPQPYIECKFKNEKELW